LQTFRPEAYPGACPATAVPGRRTEGGESTNPSGNVPVLVRSAVRAITVIRRSGACYGKQQQPALNVYVSCPA
ncbi:hypothetical protein OEZ79_27215, partial [Leclercia adecarboxylata]